MKNASHHKLFSSTNCLSEQTIYDYIDKKLNDKEQHAVEKHLLDCDLCSDALDGLLLVQNRNRISTINKAIDARISNKKEAKVVFFNYRTITYMAAAIALLIGGVFFFKFSITNNEADIAELKVVDPLENVTANSPSISDEETDGKTLEQTIHSDSSSARLNDISFETETTANEREKNKFAKKETNTETKTNKDFDDFYKSPIVANEKQTLKSLDHTINNQNGLTTQTPATIASSTTNVTAISGEENAAPENSGYALEKVEAKPKQDNLDKEESKNNAQAAPTFAKQQAEKAAAPQSVPRSEIAANTKEQKSVADKKSKELENLKSKKKTSAYENIETDYSKTETQESKLAEMDEAPSPTETTLFANADSTYTVVDEMPQYPGGNVELINYFKNKISSSTPSKTDANKTTTEIIYIQFVVTKEGKAIQPTVVKNNDKELEKKVVDLVNKMPVWKPGKLKGERVDVKYTLPISIEKK